MGRDLSKEYDAIFAALAHPVRRSMLERLARRDAGVQELAGPYGLSLPTISRHLRMLERAGLVSVTHEWRYRTRHLNVRPLAEAFGWLTQYRMLWEQSFDRLEGVLTEDSSPPIKNLRTRGRSR